MTLMPRIDISTRHTTFRRFLFRRLLQISSAHPAIQKSDYASRVAVQGVSLPRASLLLPRADESWANDQGRWSGAEDNGEEWTQTGATAGSWENSTSLSERAGFSNRAHALPRYNDRWTRRAVLLVDLRYSGKNAHEQGSAPSAKSVIVVSPGQLGKSAA